MTTFTGLTTISERMQLCIEMSDGNIQMQCSAAQRNFIYINIQRNARLLSTIVLQMKTNQNTYAK